MSASSPPNNETDPQEPEVQIKMVQVEAKPRDEKAQLWSKFYMKAINLTSKQAMEESKSTKEDIAKHHNQSVIVTLDTITKLIFGLEGSQKGKVIVFGGGALELILALVHSSNALSSTSTSTLQDDKEESRNICSSSVKAIKTCVVRNPVGRCRCRTAGVSAFLKDILDAFMMKESLSDSDLKANALLVEDVITALAAICLGDDLNALQACTQFRPYLTKATKIYPNESSMNQKITYLQNLFEAIEKEQSKLLKHLQKEQKHSQFIQNITDAEINVRTAFGHVQDEKYQKAEQHYNHAIVLIDSYSKFTKLFDPLVVEIRCKRAKISLELNRPEKCLEDTTILLENQSESTHARAQVLKLHAKALIALNRVQDGKKTLGKLQIICPQDDEVVQLLDKLSLDNK